jgi:hypothetical protein
MWPRNGGRDLGRAATRDTDEDHALTRVLDRERFVGADPVAADHVAFGRVEIGDRAIRSKLGAASRSARV